MKNGRKVPHWIWYIFQQEKGLVHSYNSQFYGLDGVKEARAYLEHPVLGYYLEKSKVMDQYLLDTDMVIEMMRSPYSAASQMVRQVTMATCFIADITLYEFYCVAAESNMPDANYAFIDYIKSSFKVLNSSDAYIEASRQKLRLKKLGTPIEEKDLLIGCTAKVYGLTLVTGNLKHMSRIEGLDVCSLR